MSRPGRRPGRSSGPAKGAEAQDLGLLCRARDALARAFLCCRLLCRDQRWAWQHQHALPADPLLEPARLELWLPSSGDRVGNPWRPELARRRSQRDLHHGGNHWRAVDRLPGRLLRLTPRWPLARTGCRAADPAVLDLLHHADVRLDQPARARRLWLTSPQRTFDRLALLIARTARRHRLAWRPGNHRDHRPDLRLCAVLHPAALCFARPHRPARDRSRARPWRAATELILARDPADVEAGNPRRTGARCAADGRRLLHADADERLALDEHDRQHDQRLHPRRAR